MSWQAERVHAAAARGSLSEAFLDAALGAGFNIDSYNSQGETALFLAASNQHPDELLWLLKKGANPNKPNADGDLPLRALTDIYLEKWNEVGYLDQLMAEDEGAVQEYGAEYARLHRKEEELLDMIEALLDAGADADAGITPPPLVANGENLTAQRQSRLDAPSTPLQRAIRENNITFTKMLLKHGARYQNALDDYRGVEIGQIGRGNWSYVYLLVNSSPATGYSPHYVQGEDGPEHWWGKTPLWAAIYSDNPNIIHSILDLGGYPDEYDQDIVTEFVKYMHQENDPSIRVLTRLVHTGFSVEGTSLIAERDGKKYLAGSSPLLAALQKDYIRTALVLLNLGASADYRLREPGEGEGPETLLGLALEQFPRKRIPDEAMSGIVQVLLEKGADPNGFEEELGVMPIHMALYENMPLTMKALIQGGADIYALNTDGQSAMDLALGLGLEGVKLLADAGIDLNKVDINGRTFLHMTRKPDIAAFLIEKGLDVNEKDNGGNTPLHTASKAGIAAVVQALLQAGANPTIKNNEGKTALDIAKARPVISLLQVSMGIQAPMWKGFPRSGAESLNIVFDDPENYAFCPVCTALIYRSAACRYMKHNCLGDTSSYVHERLYHLYKTDDQTIGTCIVCGRVCTGHRHHTLGHASAAEKTSLAPPPPPHQARNMYFGGAAQCRAEGGGGLEEKILRMDTFLRAAAALESEVDKITDDEARKRLIETAWNAPLDPQVNPQALLAGKRWSVPLDTFRNIAVIRVNQGALPNVRKPNTNTDLKPIVHDKEHTDIVSLDDIKPAIQLVHREQNGKINRHEDSFVGKATLENVLRNYIKEPQADAFGYCFAYPECTGLLYPEDIEPFIDDKELFQKYKALFNAKFRKRGGRRRPRKTRRTHGGGQKDPFFPLAEHMLCDLPSRFRRIKGGTRKKGRKTRRVAGR